MGYSYNGHKVNDRTVSTRGQCHTDTSGHVAAGSVVHGWIKVRPTRLSWLCTRLWQMPVDTYLLYNTWGMLRRLIGLFASTAVWNLGNQPF